MLPMCISKSLGQCEAPYWW
ncbi:hypothetical protein OPV22_031189 [Ensete ventricosum]|uniref:Uncharacterized protein n=1 Tax=Ensete ventricosum TaxID=4639 RepID=A0AAV8PNW6_ENSVE|nr:hypothetical protein OPV22_031189 [Ensete ventricosum]